MIFNFKPYLWSKRISPYTIRVGINRNHIYKINNNIDNFLPNKIILNNRNYEINNTSDVIGLFYKSEYDKSNFYKIYSPIEGTIVKRNELLIHNPDILFNYQKFINLVNKKNIYNHNHQYKFNNYKSEDYSWLFDVEYDFTQFDYPLVMV